MTYKFEEMTWDQWVERFKPIPNPIAQSPAVDDVLMYETYGKEIELVKNANPNTVWTWVDGDFSSLLLSGFHYVNRIGYYLTEVPFENDTDYHVLISRDVECECYDEEAMENGEREEYGDPNCKECEGYGYKTEDIEEL